MDCYWNNFLKTIDYSNSDKNDFASNGFDAGSFEEFDRILWNDDKFSRIVGVNRPTAKSDGQRKVMCDKVKVNSNQRKLKLNSNQKSMENKCVECRFCKNNGEKERLYKSHQFKDANGKVQCPVLRMYVCPICHQSGDTAHTVKYCPKKRIFSLEDTIHMERRRQNFTQQIVISV
uniref:Nanos2 n=1 Tax=Clogmia albipunctata TaxID=85120 RepID=A0A5P8HWE6_CLOAL|nr:nanos2 [Clogmia albipunctata]